MFKRAKRVLASAKRPVLAGYDKGKPRSVTLALMQCGTCSTELVTNHSLHAGCPVCASTMEPVDEIIVRDKSGEPVIDDNGEPQIKTLDLSVKQLTDMPVVAKCHSCGTDFRGDDEIVANLSGHNIHCPVCASAITLSAEEEDYSEDEPLEEIEEPEDIGEEDSGDEEFYSGDEESEEPVADESEDPGVADSSDEPIPDTVIPDSSEEEKPDDSAGSEMTDEEFAAGLRTEASVKRKKLKVKKLKRVSAAAEEDETDEEDDQDEMEPPQTPAADIPELPVNETFASFQVNAFDLARNKKNIAFNFVMAGDKNVVWYLFANHRPVAVAKKENVAQSMHGIFATSAFGRAFAAAAGDGVTDEVVKDFGLEPVIIEQPVSEVVEQQVNRQVEEKTVELSKAIAETRAQFEQCAGIAAVGINKGFFGKANPLRQPFIDALASVNVRSPERLVDKVLAEHGEDYLRTIIAKAMELQAKSPETLNEIASLVEASVYKVEASTVVNRADEVSENLTRGNFPISISGFSEAVAGVKTPEPHDNVRQIFGPLGRRRA